MEQKLKVTVLLGLSLVFVLLLAACAPGFSLPIPGLAQPTPTEDCGCTLEGPNKIATPTGGIVQSGPAGPSAASATPEPVDLPALKGQWVPFIDQKSGVSFEYPAAYLIGPYKFCAAREGSLEGFDGATSVINLGSRTTLSVYPLKDQTLQSAVEAFKNGPSGQNAQFDTVQERTVGSLPALTLPYRSGGANRYSEVIFLIQGDDLYRVDAGTPPSACDIAEIDLRELDAYSHLLETLRFK